MLKPKGPYFRLYWTSAWKNVNEYRHCNHYLRRLEQLFITSSEIYLNEREMFGFMPRGGYNVILLAF